MERMSVSENERESSERLKKVSRVRICWSFGQYEQMREVLFGHKILLLFMA